MGDGKGKWIRFEDGLIQGKELDPQLCAENENTYNSFRKNYYDSMVKSPFMLICFTVPKKGGKGKQGKINKEQLTDDFVQTALLDSIMAASYQKEQEVPAIAVIKCAKGEVSDAVYRQACAGKVLKIEQLDGVGDIRNKIEEGYRVIVNGEWKFRKKITVHNIQELIKTIYDMGVLNILKVLADVFGKMGCGILAFFAVNIDAIKSCLPKEGILVLYFIFFMSIGLAIKGIRKKIWIMYEIECLGEIGYPVIFFNATKKDTGWIQSYIKGINRQSSKSLPLCISVDKLNIQNLMQFVIPKGYPNWGWLCLCKLTRSVADNPWNERTLKRERVRTK